LGEEKPTVAAPLGYNAVNGAINFLLGMETRV
jgi:hypothetical protein